MRGLKATLQANMRKEHRTLADLHDLQAKLIKTKVAFQKKERVSNWKLQQVHSDALNSVKSLRNKLIKGKIPIAPIDDFATILEPVEFPEASTQPKPKEANRTHANLKPVKISSLISPSSKLFSEEKKNDDLSSQLSFIFA